MEKLQFHCKILNSLHSLYEDNFSYLISFISIQQNHFKGAGAKTQGKLLQWQQIQTMFSDATI